MAGLVAETTDEIASDCVIVKICWAEMIFFLLDNKCGLFIQTFDEFAFVQVLHSLCCSYLTIQNLDRRHYPSRRVVILLLHVTI